MDERAARRDEELLSGVPEWVALGVVLKASPSEDGGNRFLYFEASNEDPDHQGEIVLQKALADSSDYYIRHGNVDLSHYTILGPKAGIPNHYDYEVGRPVAVRIDGNRTFVKAQLYTGSSPMARNANMVWDSLTKQQPPAKWFASVGGAVLAKSVRFDPKSQNRVAVVERVRWNNTALDRCPVNKSVPEVSVAPVGTFAKSLGGFIFTKSDGGAPAGLVAGYGTDSASLTGGAALRHQSLEPRVQSYWDFRDRIASDVRAKRVPPSVEALTDHAISAYGLAYDEAADWTERFLGDLRTALSKRKAR
ncbi:conserved protein of unknown function (plasmid) [Rhodovastum atsumiense]|uniref:Uncharacterized protein n=1 Tax=Rhodovastum atsumiense TaxID=504468 RepID=A0A5M6ITF2_9PROT|nr:hypothetical protein [Rhodovastum atsumiense]KAA5611593.1 hypothetical protein F1189_13600 [Rhodovastum atsumiense]CAH2606323.1 conserved protein of unknown function [Rhodovastum atsumiense]